MAELIYIDIDAAYPATLTDSLKTGLEESIKQHLKGYGCTIGRVSIAICHSNTVSPENLEILEGLRRFKATNCNLLLDQSEVGLVLEMCEAGVILLTRREHRP